MARFLLERALMPLAPGWAMRRIGARIQGEQLMRAYDGAKPSRGAKGWRAPSTSAAAEDQGQLSVLRNRSRDLCRNDPWMRKARRMIPAHMVGTGVVPRPTSGAEVTRRRAMAAWNEWSAETDGDGAGFAGQQLAVAGAVVESGEAFVLWTADAQQPGGWRTRVLEGDYLDDQYHEASRNGGGRIVSGVEFDAAGRRVAYHFWRSHPGDNIPILSRISERVRVEARFVDHVFERLRPGQVRGVPWLAASMMTVRDLGDYREAERWRKKIAAAFAAFLTTPNPAAQSPLGQVTTETDGSGRARAVERIAPGTIKRLVPGEDIKFATPPTDGGFAEYLRWELLAVSAGIGLPYSAMTGDLSNANYSSMRADKIEYWSLLDTWQELMLEPFLLRRAWNRVQATAGVPGQTAEWGYPKRHWVDPLKDVQAEIRAIRAGLVSAPDAIAARGYDWRDVLAEQRAYLAQAAALDLVLDTDPKTTAQNGAVNDVAASSD